MMDLIPLDALFGNPELLQPQVSPDGRWLSWLADHDGVQQVWLAPADDPDASRPLTSASGGGAQQHRWAWTSRHVLVPLDRDGDENWHVHAVDIDTGVSADLTPIDDARAELLGLSPTQPGKLLIGRNDRDPRVFDAWLTDIVTGETELAFRNDDGFAALHADHDLVVRVAVRATPDGGGTILARDHAAAPWREVLTFSQADSRSVAVIGIRSDGYSCDLLSSVDRDTAALVRLDLRDGTTTLIAEDDRVDVSRIYSLFGAEPEVLRDARTGRPLAVWFEHAVRRAAVVDPCVDDDIARLEAALPGGYEVPVTDADRDLWVVPTVAGDQPPGFHLYRPDEGAPTPWRSARPVLEGRLGMRRPIPLTARDGLPLLCYLTLPATVDAERPTEPLPTVVWVHGGPWAHERGGFQPYHHWLADRGYAVLGVNFRGSTGFGKRFLGAADLQWGRQMQDDLHDAVAWAIDAGISAPSRIGIGGGSYGGYATLAGLAFTPDVFACGVDIFGPSELETLQASVPPYWTPIIRELHSRVGDPTTEQGRALLAQRSPLHHAAEITKPLLIVQGANDPRVKPEQSERIVEALRAAGTPVTYLVLPDEGHGFTRPANRMAVFSIIETFLARHLGGDAAPLSTALESSSVQVIDPGGLPLG